MSYGLILCHATESGNSHIHLIDILQIKNNFNIQIFYSLQQTLLYRCLLDRAGESVEGSSEQMLTYIENSTNSKSQILGTVPGNKI